MPSVANRRRFNRMAKKMEKPEEVVEDAITYGIGGPGDAVRNTISIKGLKPYEEVRSLNGILLYGGEPVKDSDGRGGRYILAEPDANDPSIGLPMLSSRGVPLVRSYERTPYDVWSDVPKELVLRDLEVGFGKTRDGKTPAYPTRDQLDALLAGDAVLLEGLYRPVDGEMQEYQAEVEVSFKRKVPKDRDFPVAYLRPLVFRVDGEPEAYLRDKDFQASLVKARSFGTPMSQMIESIAVPELSSFAKTPYHITP